MQFKKYQLRKLRNFTFHEDVNDFCWVNIFELGNNNNNNNNMDISSQRTLEQS